MITRQQRIAQGRSRIASRAIGTARNIGGHWGLPPEEAAAALEAAAVALRDAVATGRIDWPTEDERAVSNGTPDQTVLAMASAVVMAQSETPTVEGVARALVASGVKRRRSDLLRLVKEATLVAPQ